MAGRAIVAVVLAPVCAYITLWLGGALEVFAHDEDPAGQPCAMSTSYSDQSIGTEEARWFGGGIPARPGLVCVTPEPPEPERLLTQYDVLSAAMATLVFIVVAVVAVEAVVAERHR